MRASQADHGRVVVARSLLVVLLVGCAGPMDDPPAVTPVELRVAPWADQVAAVRAREANAIEASRDPVTAEQWAMLAEGCESLEKLDVDVRLLTSENLNLLHTLPRLRWLILRGPVDDSVLQGIAALSTLRILNLPDAEFTDAGLQVLTAWPRLEQLRFGSPHVTDEGLAAITELPALRFLHLIDVPITDAGLAHLHGLTDLESFYLDGGRCTDEGLHALLHALPELHFHRDQLHLPDDPHDHPHE